MKKWILLSVLGTGILAACSKKTVPGKETGAVKPETEKTTEKTAAPVTPADSVKTDTNPVAGMTNETLVKNGEAIFKAKCGKCHGLKNPGDYTSDRWDGILKVMFPRAKLEGAEQHEVLAYIKANAKQ